ncbi:hypothetical protein CWI38_0191p0020 [Hamiltosporidium tvaerminnensis]|uniref:Uncharacterized protein n=1 Tax=Hamiltosporidium tvaerminnensis TaxID=1176355 RepID=A0A4Q9LA05_9MICR|nr:hypothetical protein LUQ84_001600 [Hamiltosporidium tvaerminnensis]TBU04589.1 hypothetical protein CWI37_0115p0020 [Hamiltosporidium tvaerminnensis]TBU19830.1 hypothetical protein CWI38_0191p0020 [Hamiltosporidium tvaerminnensis]
MIFNVFATIISAATYTKNPKSSISDCLKNPNQNIDLHLTLNSDSSNDFMEMDGSIHYKQTNCCSINQNISDCVGDEPIQVLGSNKSSNDTDLRTFRPNLDIQWQECTVDKNIGSKKSKKNGSPFKCINIKTTKSEKKLRNSKNESQVRKHRLRNKMLAPKLIREKVKKNKAAEKYHILYIERKIQENIHYNATKKRFDTYCYYFNMLEIFRLRNNNSSKSLTSIILDNIMFGHNNIHTEEINKEVCYFMQTMDYFAIQSIHIQTNTHIGFDEILLRPNEIFKNLLHDCLLYELKAKSYFIENKNHEICFFLFSLISNVLITEIEEDKKISIFIKKSNDEYDVIEKSNNRIYTWKKKFEFSIENINPKKNMSSTKKKIKSNGTFNPPSYQNKLII